MIRPLWETRIQNMTRYEEVLTHYERVQTLYEGMHWFYISHPYLSLSLYQKKNVNSDSQIKERKVTEHRDTLLILEGLRS